MTEPYERLAAARQKAGYDSPTDAARAFGWNEVTYRAHENGGRNLSRQAAGKYAKGYRVTAGWLLYGEAEREKTTAFPKVRLAGHIGAGQQIFPDSDFGEQIDATLGPVDCEALIIRGTSMMPVARDGDIAFFGAPRPLLSLIGKECAVELADGRRFFKVLRHGSRPGLFSLDSYNQEQIPDVKVAKAGPLLAIRRNS